MALGEPLAPGLRSARVERLVDCPGVLVRGRSWNPANATTSTAAAAIAKRRRCSCRVNLHADQNGRRCGVVSTSSRARRRSARRSRGRPREATTGRCACWGSRSMVIGMPPLPPGARRHRVPPAWRASRDGVGKRPCRGGCPGSRPPGRAEVGVVVKDQHGPVIHRQASDGRSSWSRWMTASSPPDSDGSSAGRIRRFGDHVRVRRPSE